MQRLLDCPLELLLLRFSRRFIILCFLALLLFLTWDKLGGVAQSAPSLAHVKVYGGFTGRSTRYIGTCEGNVNFDQTDIVDLGINTYRLYGGMSRWEPQDDDGVYGLPTIDQIKADPDIIPWNRWDTVMTVPDTGTDYAFSGVPGKLWQGSAETLFETLKHEHVRSVLTIRNVDSSWNPEWALQLNPPRTEADWNEWWEHVFATVYWLNVRNDYQVNDFEIHNEPDNRLQGWGGNQDDYFELLQVASDAIAHVYATYLPDREFHIHAPKTLGGSHWPGELSDTVPAYFDIVNVHNYDWDITSYVKRVRRWMGNTLHERSPLWIGEWGTYTGGYDDLAFALNLIKNMMRMSQPGDSYVYGSHLFSLYDWGEKVEGLVSATGDRRLSYYAFRMGIRALQGGRSVLLTTISTSNVMAMTTQDTEGNLSLLLVNDQPEARRIIADVSSLFTEGSGTIWEFSAAANDEVVADVSIEEGSVILELPAYASHLLSLSPEMHT
ncbi:MAG: hypothetical protein AAFY20_09710 [Cyanobacteria bacterium J06639_14]